MLPRSPYRPLSAKECGVCCDGLGFRARPCVGCGKQKIDDPGRDQRIAEAQAVQEEYLARWRIKFQQQEARAVQAAQTDAREATRGG